MNNKRLRLLVPALVLACSSLACLIGPDDLPPFTYAPDAIGAGATYTMGGDIDGEFSVDDSSVLEIIESDARTVTVRGVSPGVATLTHTTGDTVRTASIEVRTVASIEVEPRGALLAGGTHIVWTGTLDEGGERLEGGGLLSVVDAPYATVSPVVNGDHLLVTLDEPGEYVVTVAAGDLRASASLLAVGIDDVEIEWVFDAVISETQHSASIRLRSGAEEVHLGDVIPQWTLDGEPHPPTWSEGEGGRLCVTLLERTECRPAS